MAPSDSSTRPVSGETKRARQHEDHRERQRARFAAIAKSGRDIGPLPPVADPERRAAGLGSLRLYLELYFPHKFHLAWSPDHLKMIDRIERAINEGLLYALGAPRGTGKSSILECAVLWATTSGRRKFAMLIGPSKDPHAEQMLVSIKVELETNELLLADFPEICRPIVALEGISNRPAGQLCQGKRTRIGWGKYQIVLPTIEGSQASGAIIRVAGITGSGVRGPKAKVGDKTVRPDLVLVDDFQTDKSAKSVTQCEERERIITGAILGMAGPGQTIAGFITCTVMRRDDAADRLLNRDIHHEWQGERLKLIYAWPKNKKLWEEYEVLRIDSLKAGGDGSEATAFYSRHRKAMDEGAIVAWPERRVAGELSGIQHAMNLSIDKREIFYAEYQNEPVAEKFAEEQLDASELAKRGNNVPRGTVDVDFTRLTAFIDVKQKVLHWMVHGWTKDFGGAPVDYKTWPDQQRRYFSTADAQKTIAAAFPTAEFEGALFAALDACADHVLGRPWVTQGGVEMRVEKCLVDANWGPATELIYRWCRQSKYAAIVMPSHGKYFGAASPPFEHYKRKEGEQLGAHWWLPPVSRKRAIRHVMIDTNHWKAFYCRRLMAAVGDRGAIVLPGKSGAELRLLVEHFTSEFFTRTHGHARDVDEWTLRPGRDNDFWDCGVGCAVAASMLGLEPIGAARAAKAIVKPRKKRTRVSYL